MNTNYLQQYDEIVAYVEAYSAYSAKLYSRNALKNILPSSKRRRQTAAFVRQYRPLSNKMPDFYREMAEDVATADDRKNPYYQIMTSDYIIDALAADVTRRFPDFDFEKLKSIHEMKKEVLTVWDFMRQSLGLVLAAGTILLRSVPESVVRRYYPDYAEFEFFVFWVTAGTVALLLLMFLPTWLKLNGARNKLRLIGNLLTYITLQQGRMPERSSQKTARKPKQKRP